MCMHRSERRTKRRAGKRAKLSGEYEAVRGDRGESDKQQRADIEPDPRANSLHQRLLIFPSRSPSLSHRPLACHTGNYLLNTPGSDSVCVRAPCVSPVTLQPTLRAPRGVEDLFQHGPAT